MPPPKRKITIEQFDEDGNGSIDNEELRDAYYKHGKNFKALFDAVDEDGNSSLDREEMGRFFIMIGKSHSDAKNLFRDFDVNGDGKISYSEFNTWLNKEYISKTFNVKQCEQAISNTQREFVHKGEKHEAVLAITEELKVELAKVEAEMVPYRQERNEVVAALSKKRREAAQLRKQMEMINMEMHKQHELMKIAMPARRAVSRITLMELGHQKHHTSYAQLPRRGGAYSSSVGRMNISRSSPLMNAGMMNMSQKASRGGLSKFSGKR